MLLYYYSTYMLLVTSLGNVKFSRSLNVKSQMGHDLGNHDSDCDWSLFFFTHTKNEIMNNTQDYK